LLFWKIVIIVATRCHILSFKCTKIDFGWGSAPDPLAGFKGPTSKGTGGVGERRGEKGRVMEGALDLSASSF